MIGIPTDKGFTDKDIKAIHKYILAQKAKLKQDIDAIDDLAFFMARDETKEFLANSYMQLPLYI